MLGCASAPSLKKKSEVIDRNESRLIQRERVNRERRPRAAMPPRRAPKKLAALYRYVRD
jgi:hypothetical protein